MSKAIIGLLFILFGIGYGSLIIDRVYSETLGYLIANNWINPPIPSKTSPGILGRKVTILLYSLAFITIGIFLLWNQNK